MTQTEQPNVLVHLDERDRGSRIATITINNPHKLNTNNALMKDLLPLRGFAFPANLA
jgi:enoyl-CoA hydratase/carnithine racemase